MPAPAPLPEFSSLVDLNGALRAGRLKARDLVRAAARALSQEARPGGAVRELLEEDALGAARDVEKELARGRTRGLLQGAPFAVSETLSLARRVPPWNPGADPRRVEDAAAVARLRGARSIPLALASSPPLGGLLAGPAAAESAAASLVGRRLVPFALAVDFNGNVLRGALEHACCALRPTFGLASAFGIAPLGWTLASAAVLAGSAEDCGFVLERISGADSRSPHSPGRGFRYAPQYARPLDQLRVAVAPDAGPLLAALADLRSGLAEFPVPDLPATSTLETILAAEAGEAFADLLAASPEGRAFLDEARSLAAFDYLRAMRLRRMAQEWLSAALERADVLLLPWRHSHDPASPDLSGEVPCRLCEFLALALLAGAPVFASGKRAGALFCAVARPFSENTLLRLVSTLEKALPQGGGGWAGSNRPSPRESSRV
ncbi:MAG: amidase [Bryobacteraceae bacterium]|nr:amidase [Bryobacteraceae bacterium]